MKIQDAIDELNYNFSFIRIIKYSLYSYIFYNLFNPICTEFNFFQDNVIKFKLEKDL